MAKVKVALIMAGGTGGHIFPGIALAEQLREKGWQVHWLGAPGNMEERIAAEHQLPFEPVNFSGLRGKGFLPWLRLPVHLFKAFAQSYRVLRRLRPQVVLGMGGYITFPAGIVAKFLGIPLYLHEQNSIAGMSNKVLAIFASKVFTAFPQVFKRGHWVGNPLRLAFSSFPSAAERYAQRQGPLQILVMGGSLGAQALNQTVPQALALIPEQQRPQVTHQGGEKQIAALRDNYARAGVEAELLPFIQDVAGSMARADLLICRAGASTVCEVAAIGVAALFVPYPHAVDDHQTANAHYLADADGAILCPQNEFTPEYLADVLQKMSREQLKKMAMQAKSMHRAGAAESMALECEGLLA